MLHSLPLFHRIAGQRVVVVGSGAMADAKARLVERAGGVPCAETEAHHAKLAFVALEDERAAEATATRLKRLGLLVNVADRPDLCDFTLPSVLERGPVLIAVSTGGASAGLAKHLRLRLERILPETLGTLADALNSARDKIRSRFPNADARRTSIDQALCDGGQLDPLVPQPEDAVENWLAGTKAPVRDGVIEFTLTSDDPEDLTLKQARALGTADVILHDPAIPEGILIRARADAERVAMPADPASHKGLVIVLNRAI